MIEEIWKDIEGYEGLYQISSQGRVKSLEREETHEYSGGIMNRILKEKIIKTNLNKHNYYNVQLHNNTSVKSFQVARLVASAFVPNPDNKPCVDHIDGVTTNNVYTNLRWVSRKENSNNKHAIEKYKKMKNACGKKRNRRVIQYDKNYNQIKEWDNVKEAAIGMNVSKTLIYNSCNKDGVHPRGYIFKYKQKKHDTIRNMMP